ncbi:MAG TPA: ATP-binding cassette domain-containing protein [Terrimicrobiaceae bacterium]|nr:ATP-binding cassette domain-containing protein [Terrimicrobiaceae bacterium]
MASAISVRNLSITVREKRRTKTLLSNVNFEVERGKFIAVIGASGCGKSTLIKSLAGLIEPTSGKILFADQTVQDLNDHLPLAVGYLPQFGAFHEQLTVGENLDAAAALRLPRKVSLDRRQAWMDHISDLARIGPFLPQEYRTLSGGQMRRMALAEELIGDPAFLLLDELTSGLDAFSDQEMMAWLRDLAHNMSKTVVLVTHATNNLHYCDAIMFLHKGRLIHYGDYQSLLDSHEVTSIAELFGVYQTQELDLSAFDHSLEDSPPAHTDESIAIQSMPPPSGLVQFSTLLARQAKLFWRDRGQIVLHIALILTFPFLVAVFATSGLPQVRSQTLSLETNILRTLQEQLFYLKESFQAASLISGLAMFQVILLTLIGANNGAREIAKERGILAKELRAGLSPTAYVGVKFLQIALLCMIQAFWMAWFVKTICGFPGNLLDQFSILFATTLAMSTTCLAISAASPSPERASLLAIYLVGFQLPLSGAALALPDWLSTICRPFIAAYWGWSGYLQTFRDTRYFDIVRQSSETWVAPYALGMSVLGIHVLLALVAAIFLAASVKRRTSE